MVASEEGFVLHDAIITRQAPKVKPSVPLVTLVHTPRATSTPVLLTVAPNPITVTHYRYVELSVNPRGGDNDNKRLCSRDNDRPQMDNAGLLITVVFRYLFKVQNVNDAIL